jgi:hypothetical protein
MWGMYVINVCGGTGAKVGVLNQGAVGLVMILVKIDVVSFGNVNNQRICLNACT